MCRWRVWFFFLSDIQCNANLTLLYFSGVRFCKWSHCVFHNVQIFRIKLLNVVFTLHPFPDRTQQRLEIAVAVAEGTLNRSAEVLQTVTPISNKVEKWSNSMRNNEYSTAAYEQAVLSAGEAGILTTTNIYIAGIHHVHMSFFCMITSMFSSH